MFKKIISKVSDLFKPSSPTPMVAGGSLEEIRSCVEKGVNPNLGVSYAKASLSSHEKRENTYCSSLVDFVLSPVEDRIFCTDHWFDIKPLMTASYNGSSDIVKLLIANGADVNGADSIGMTAISYALFESHEEVVKILLENGANASAAVHASAGLRSETVTKDCERYEVKSLDILLRLANSSTVTGLAPIFFAVAQSTPAMVQMLARHGADVNARNSYGETPLEYAMQVRMDPDKGAILIAAGAGYDLTQLEERSVSPNKRFSTDFRARLLEFLLRADSKDEKSINQLYSWCLQYKDNFYTSIYAFAAGNNFRELLRYHIARNSAGIPAEIDRYQPLVWAVDKLEIPELLLESGFADNLTQEQWLTIFSRALSQHTRTVPEVLHTLTAKMKSYCNFSGEQWSALWAGGIADSERVTAMLDLCPDINFRDAQGSTVLIKLAESSISDPAGAKLILASGIDINARNNEGNTALIQAVKYCRTPLVACLLAAKADVEIKNGAGKNALQIATGRKQNEIIAMLKAHRP
ncbi:MAG: ankyrin repeat domain-containing protein [Candidatus Riflebacteria bacterium]|nr:ankyrin repeat domain-containing protein [Candidatus Riflebacteria bacterium]